MANLRPTAEWWIQAALYRRFADEARYGAVLDFSEAAAEAMYAYETFGQGVNPYGVFTSSGHYNGYAIGKRWLNWQRNAWREGIQDGLITKADLLADESLPHDLVRQTLAEIPAATFAPFRTAQ